MAKVTLRKKPITKGRQTLYLDYYPPITHPDTGKPVRREYLKIYLFDRPRTEMDKEHNRETHNLAENIRAMRQIEIQNQSFGFLSDSKRNADFINFFKETAIKRSGSNADNWNMAVQYFISFAGQQLRFADLNEILSEDYRDYLLKAPSIGRAGRSISTNTAVSYFGKFRATLKAAFKAGYISANIGERIDGIKARETHREYLSLEELQRLAKTDCESVIIKKAALFSALTGLRFSDIEKLTWNEVRGTEANYYLRFRQEKTEGVENLPLSDQAVSLLGERCDVNDKVFKGLKYTHIDTFLPKWIFKAGIDKHVTFHSFRHTYATLQLAAGTDIYTVSKMLGHRNLKTTQVYTKIVDEKKKEAANRIKLDL